MSNIDANNISIDWEVRTKEILIQLQRDAPQEGLSYGLSRYMLDRRPFALATQSAQDLKNQTSRLSDIICGVPFTSEKHPWPKDDKSGLWMQPVVQLNLATLKEVFQVDWGAGILQVWGHVLRDVNAFGLSEQPMMMRLLPASDLVDPLDPLIPNWKNEGDSNFFCFFDESSYAGREIFKWARAGNMYGNRQQLLDFCYDKVEDFGDEEFEWLDGVMEALSESPLCAENNSNFLGGWGGRYGEHDASCGDGLVLRISDGEGAVVAIHRQLRNLDEGDFLVTYSLR